MDWSNFRRKIQQLVRSITDNPTQFVYVLVLTFVICDMLSFISSMTGPTPAKKPAVPATTAITTTTSDEIKNIATFPPIDFTMNTMTEHYQNGDWDGTTIFSHSGNHIASIDEIGKLWIDNLGTNGFPDLESDDTQPSRHLAFYRNESGTFTYNNMPMYREDGEAFVRFARWQRGKLMQEYLFPADQIEKDGHFCHYEPYILNDVVILCSGERIIMCNPTESEVFTLLYTGNLSAHKKTSATTLQVLDVSEDRATQRIEIHADGTIIRHEAVNHEMYLRPVADYPELGDFDEFWLLRTAYTTGKWDGKNASIYEIAHLLELDLKDKPTTGVKDPRAPSLNALSCAHLDANSLARITGEHIVVNNAAKYYLHATAPWLVDDISYRKVRTANYHSGFCEIDYQTQAVCRFTYALSPLALAEQTNIDFTNAVIPLPTDNASAARDLEILEAYNAENSTRAVLLGYYDGDPDNPDATYEVWLSRVNSNFSSIATDAYGALLSPILTPVQILEKVPDAPLITGLKLTIFGKGQVHETPDIFVY